MNEPTIYHYNLEAKTAEACANPAECAAHIPREDHSTDHTVVASMLARPHLHIHIQDFTPVRCMKFPEGCAFGWPLEDHFITIEGAIDKYPDLLPKYKLVPDSMTKADLKIMREGKRAKVRR